MAKRTKVPRASIACTILDDPDFIGLMLDDSGRQAFALFCALLAAAKAQDNDGKFIQGSAIIAVMVRWPLDRFNISLADLTERTDWVASTDVGVTIRSFRKWNSWGGKRESSGAPNDNQNARKNQSSVDARINQDAPKNQSNMVTPVSVSVSDSKDNNLSSANADASTQEPVQPKQVRPFEYPADFERFWKFYPRKVGKGDAFKFWKRMDSLARVAAVDRAEWVKGCWEHNDPHGDRAKYCKHPATWLNDRGWEDSDSDVELMARGR